MLEVGKAILKNSLTYGIMDINLVTASRKELATLRAVFAYAPYAINGRGILVDYRTGDPVGDQDSHESVVYLELGMVPEYRRTGTGVVVGYASAFRRLTREVAPEVHIPTCGIPPLRRYYISDEVTVVRDTRGKDGGRDSWRKFLYCFPQARLRLIPDAPGYRAASGAEDLDLAEGVIVHSNGEVTGARRDSMLLVQPFQPVA